MGEWVGQWEGVLVPPLEVGVPPPPPPAPPAPNRVPLTEGEVDAHPLKLTPPLTLPLPLLLGLVETL